MRIIYGMLIAAATFLTCSNARSLTSDPNQTQLPQPVVLEKRSLRTNKVIDDEERVYANIFSIERNFPETITCLGDWLKSGNTIKQVAGHLKVNSYNTNDENWNALLQFVIMKHSREYGKRIDSEQAAGILKRIFDAA
ncbi:Avirulence (Avh) protein [Phytophthora megakarya]|uniref:RxLR effector protein n=1 Tax=Phytophthora megakarya TaxID=4795 RepID=A0A225UK37_9STRA|nr:Avirulence (Avh) protein [Phytophthora megakarya]